MVLMLKKQNTTKLFKGELPKARLKSEDQLHNTTQREKNTWHRSRVIRSQKEGDFLVL